MFRVPRMNVIESENFSVETLSPWLLRYTEGARWIDIDSERTQDPGSAIQEDSIACWMPDGRPVTRPERLMVLNNVKAAFAWRGLRLDVLPPGNDRLNWPHLRGE